MIQNRRRGERWNFRRAGVVRSIVTQGIVRHEAPDDDLD
jgi:hypothetical protein